MGNFLKTRGVDLTITAMALTALMTGPAWATGTPPLPGPGAGLPGAGAGLLAGAAIIGAIGIARWWRRK